LGGGILQQIRTLEKNKVMKRPRERITALMAATTIIACLWSFFAGTTLEPERETSILG
jgi:hypothetical protein